MDNDNDKLDAAEATPTATQDVSQILDDVITNVVIVASEVLHNPLFPYLEEDRAFTDVVKPDLGMIIRKIYETSDHANVDSVFQKIEDALLGNLPFPTMPCGDSTTMDAAEATPTATQDVSQILDDVITNVVIVASEVLHNPLFPYLEEAGASGACPLSNYYDDQKRQYDKDPKESNEDLAFIDVVTAALSMIMPFYETCDDANVDSVFGQVEAAFLENIPFPTIPCGDSTTVDAAEATPTATQDVSQILDDVITNVVIVASEVLHNPLLPYLEEAGASGVCPLSNYYDDQKTQYDKDPKKSNEDLAFIDVVTAALSMIMPFYETCDDANVDSVFGQVEAAFLENIPFPTIPCGDSTTVDAAEATPTATQDVSQILDDVIMDAAEATPTATQDVSQILDDVITNVVIVASEVLHNPLLPYLEEAGASGACPLSNYYDDQKRQYDKDPKKSNEDLAFTDVVTAALGMIMPFYETCDDANVDSVFGQVEAAFLENIPFPTIPCGDSTTVDAAEATPTATQDVSQILDDVITNVVIVASEVLHNPLFPYLEDDNENIDDDNPHG